MKRSFIAVFLCLGWCSSVCAQQEISGSQSGTLGPGTYLVVGDIRVAPEATLTIAPGTTFLHNGNWKWLVYGQLSAVGTATDSIKFLSQDGTPSTRPGGIRLQPITWQNYLLSYCRFDRALNQNYASMMGGAILIMNAGLSLSHSLITNNTSDNGGGLCGQNATLSIDSCVFAANSAINGAGIYVESCPLTVTGSKFYDNVCTDAGTGGGISVNYEDQTLISNSLFAGNHSDGT